MKTVSEIQIELIKRGYPKNLVLSEDVSKLVQGALKRGAGTAIFSAKGAIAGATIGGMTELLSKCIRKCDPNHWLKTAGIGAGVGIVSGAVGGKSLINIASKIRDTKSISKPLKSWDTARVGGALAVGAASEKYLTPIILKKISGHYRGICIAKCRLDSVKSQPAKISKWKSILDSRVNSAKNEVQSLKNKGNTQGAQKLEQAIQKALS